MKLWEAAGYLASVLVLTAFCMKQIVSLRLMAIISNITFLVYGIGLGLVPIWLLHALLLPVNGWRLWQEIGSGKQIRRGGPASPSKGGARSLHTPAESGKLEPPIRTYLSHENTCIDSLPIAANILGVIIMFLAMLYISQSFHFIM